MPGRWDKKKFSEWTSSVGRTFAENTCKLIWAFNSKADIVIHLGNNKAICIEAKVESAESSYRASAGTGNKNYDFVMKQTQIQEHILNDLLNYETTFVFLSMKDNIPNVPIKSPSIGMCWEEIFTLMDKTTNVLGFVSQSMESKVISSSIKPKKKI